MKCHALSPVRAEVPVPPPDWPTTDVQPRHLVPCTADLVASAKAGPSVHKGAVTNLDWCRAEAARINRVKGRTALVYVRADLCTLYVNRCGAAR